MRNAVSEAGVSVMKGKRIVRRKRKRSERRDENFLWLRLSLWLGLVGAIGDLMSVLR